MTDYNQAISSLKTLNVLYQSNGAYADVAGYSIISLLENNRHLDQINIFYLGHEIHPRDQQKLGQVLRQYANARLTMIDAKKYNDELEKLGVNSWRGILVTWFKLLAFSDININADRLLYLNPQTIVTGDLGELLGFDFGDNLLAMSYDCLINRHKRVIDFDEDDKYYNCGVMLINHKKWLEEDCGARVREQLTARRHWPIVDQDFINVTFKGQIALLGVEFNFSSAYYTYGIDHLLRTDDLKPEYFYGYEEMMSEYYAPKVVHTSFGLTGKPWETGSKHPNRFLWKKYMSLSPWRDQPGCKAKKTFRWLLYDILPRRVFMLVYKFGLILQEKRFAKTKKS